MDGIFSWNNCRIVDPEFRWYENSSSIEVANGISAFFILRLFLIPASPSMAISLLRSCNVSSKLSKLK